MKKAAKSKKRNHDRSFLWFAIFVFGLAVFLLFGTFYDPQWEYEELLPKTVTVEKLYAELSWGKGRHEELITAEGEKFHISGGYRRGELKKEVTPGVTAEIKYMESKIFHTRHIEELCVGENMIVSYHDHRRSDRIGMICAGVLGLLASGVSLAAYCFLRHLDREKAEKRRARIEKKYGHGSGHE